MTWTELIVGLAVLGIIWYGYVLLRYYRHIFRKKASHRDAPAVQWVRAKDHPPERGEYRLVARTDQYGQVHELMQEITIVFAAAATDRLDLAPIKEALSLRIDKYRFLSPDIQASISQHIGNKFSLRLQMTVTTDEIHALWA